MTSSGSSRPARRAVVRWALRLLRREWRQHVLVVALLSFTVGGALFGTTVAYNLAPSDEGTSGSANFRFNVTVDDRPRLDEFVADAAAFFGEVELITHRDVPVAGSTEGVEIRSQDPAGRFGATMLALVDGRFPAAAGEVALTDGSARLLDASIGDAVDLGDEQATVVGIVENPHKLDDEFALAAPSPMETPDAATILLRADGDYDDSVRQFHSPAAPDNWSIEPRGQSEKTLAAIGVLVAATIAMSLVTLVAAAAFVVIAQRRQHQLGLLAAAGATERQVRLVMVAGGAAVGLIAAIAGAILAFAAWVVALPALETAGGRRLGRFDIPWWTVVAALTLAVATSLAAAWWPARTIARQPIMAALSGRPQPPRRARRSAAAAFALLAAGITAITFALDPSKDTGNVPLMIAGVIATTIGLVLLAPTAVRAAAMVGRQSPLALRIALRDLARYQSRSGAALAAVSLGLAIAVSVVAVAAANEATAGEGNLSDRQLLVHIGHQGEESTLYMPEVPATELDALGDAVEGWANTLDNPAIVPLYVAVDETVTVRVDGGIQHPTVVLGIPIDDGLRDSDLVYVATPRLLDYLSIDPATVAPDTVVLTSQRGDVYFSGDIENDTYDAYRGGPVPAVQRVPMPAYRSLPRTVLTEHGVTTAGLTVAPAGWLVESDRPLTDSQLSAAREMAAASGLTVEARDAQEGLATLRTAATGIGIGVALAILAMTVGLIRAETAGDVRTLTAVGASSRTRRGVTAATAGALAVLAVVLGMAAAYAALIAGYTPESERLRNIPVAHLLTIAVGLPLAAAAASWLLAGRQPRHLSRQLTE